MIPKIGDIHGSSFLVVDVDRANEIFKCQLIKRSSYKKGKLESDKRTKIFTYHFSKFKGK